MLHTHAHWISSATALWRWHLDLAHLLSLQSLALCFGQCFRKRPSKYIYLWVSWNLAASLIPELWKKRSLKYFRAAKLNNFLFRNVICILERLKTLTVRKEESVSCPAAQSWLLLGSFFYLHSWGSWLVHFVPFPPFDTEIKTCLLLMTTYEYLMKRMFVAISLAPCRNIKIPYS